eukprot:PITA_25821
MKLVDVETNNGLFTWNNKRGGESQVASKLDRFIISEDLMLLEKEIAASVLPVGGSDHWPIQMVIQGIGTPQNRPFIFENICLSHPDFISNIGKWWAEDLQIQGTRMFMLHKKLKHIKMRLKEWNKKDFGNIFVEKISVEIKMQILNQAMILKGFDKDKNDLVEKHHKDWENLCKKEEIFWKQKSRVQWLKEGKRNTNFFHRSTMVNREHSRIFAIIKEDGQLLQTHEEIEVELVQHFREIARESNTERDHHIKDLIKHIPNLVSREDNFNLNRLVTEVEVREILNKIQNGKAPVPDGFHVDLFKACWNIVKMDILNVVEDSRTNRSILKALNTSFISLIPKCSNTRQAHEVVHSLTNTRRAGMILQLDIAKSYEKVNWSYIRQVLKAFGFDHNWIRWVMTLVTSSSVSIFVNGSPSEIFLPSRGLTQGDPLSPFLFILMMEGLGRSIKHASLTRKNQGLPLKENGMEVNLSKSNFFFFNTHIVIQRNISRTLGIQRDSLPSKYLGIRLTKKPLQKIIWEPLFNKMQDKVKIWSSRSLNIVGRLMLTKAVLQSILVFMLSSLLAPQGVLQQFGNIQRDFVWGREDARKEVGLGLLGKESVNPRILRVSA